jgi:fused signal recognition particle receptor
MVVGVNGAGKTTSIGKLANVFREQGHKVIVGAADTYRAAANEQLEIWAQRAGVDIIRQAHGADPAAVAFDSLSSAISRNADVVIIDTAGRLHTKVNLMEELKKIRRVMEKRLPGAPHEVLLVLDATTGQNALQQVKQFSAAVSVTGLILTKLDGTAKGGIVLAISNELKVPVRFIGVGERIDDLQIFDRKAFVDALFEGFN